MTKICVIADTHAGIRNDNQNLLDHQKSFYSEIFFPYLERHHIKTVVHLGDIVDRRKFINFNTLNRLRTDFLEPLQDQVENVIILAGNHDVYFKDTNRLSSLQELLYDRYPNFTLYTEATTINLHGVSVCLVPWICRENEAHTMVTMADSEASILMGHLELYGFQMHRGSFCNKEDALKPEKLDKFRTVLTGHFHHKSDYNNIHYLGCPFQMDWGDYGDTKGFHIFDLETQDLTFISNPYSLFYKIEYDDKDKSMDDVLSLDYGKYRKSFVRIVVKNKDNAFWFETFRDKLEAAEPLSVQVIEDMGHLAFDGDETELLHVEDTISLLAKYCDQIGVADEMKPKLNTLLQSLYNEANNARLS